MRKFIVVCFVVASLAAGALGQSQDAPTLRIVSEDGNRLPSELFYGSTKVKPLRLRPGTNQPITIADNDFFVQQHYVDFLSRFPDAGGFGFWFNEINRCNGNAGCISQRRVNVSAAFFLSIEFQNTGYFVYRLYRASFGQYPRYQNFMPESRQVSSGVEVGIGEWGAKLEQNKVNFANSWVNRADFLAQYPNGMTPEAFVDKLVQNAGISAADANRDALVAGLKNNTETRATVLRKIVESAAFSAKEKNPAFVLMQYFGYLRRNPDDLPDTNFDGFNFWLGKLNQFNGDFAKAEMVRAFIESIEYNDRFR